MNDPRTDEIARAAARLLATGRVATIDEAIRAAADALGMHEAALPGHGRVRMHAGALAMQTLGDDGYAESVRRVRRLAEGIMTALTESLLDVEPLLVGRAARGQIDAGVTVHIRLYTRANVPEIAETLEGFGYAEAKFETVDTRHGRLNRLRLADDGIDVVLTRCPPELRREAGTDLFSGRPLPTATLEQLRREIGSG